MMVVLMKERRSSGKVNSVASIYVPASIVTVPFSSIALSLRINDFHQAGDNVMDVSCTSSYEHHQIYLLHSVCLRVSFLAIS